MDFKDRRVWLVTFLVVMVVVGLWALSGGGAARARKAIDAGADEFTGNRAVQQGREIESQFRAINARHKEQVQGAY